MFFRRTPEDGFIPPSCLWNHYSMLASLASYAVKTGGLLFQQTKSSASLTTVHEVSNQMQGVLQQGCAFVCKLLTLFNYSNTYFCCCIHNVCYDSMAAWERGTEL
uniref:Uncharacterized protein n=1 Tax=Labrus bergylta TaxID=56723 RepID=A0A3Q3LML5_9LABR